MPAGVAAAAYRYYYDVNASVTASERAKKNHGYDLKTVRCFLKETLPKNIIARITCELKKKKTIIKLRLKYTTLFLPYERDIQWYSTGVCQTLVPHFAYPQPFPFMSSVYVIENVANVMECKLKRLGRNIFVGIFRE